MAQNPNAGGRWYRDPKTGKPTRTAPKTIAPQTPEKSASIEAPAIDATGDTQ